MQQATATSAKEESTLVKVTGTPRAMIFLVMSGALQVIVLSITAVIASHAFMSLAAQVGRAAQPQAPA